MVAIFLVVISSKSPPMRQSCKPVGVVSPFLEALDLTDGLVGVDMVVRACGGPLCL